MHFRSYSYRFGLYTLAYILYFKGIRQVKAQNAALLSYIDPLSAICFSTVFLGEIPNKAQVIGALFIFMASFIHEIKIKNPQIKQKA
ncbi:MAG: DMT family transporter [Epulopiscium sp.]|nr:DMT family transporter [Candidatus Epulonipiscium sp.]